MPNASNPLTAGRSAHISELCNSAATQLSPILLLPNVHNWRGRNEFIRSCPEWPLPASLSSSRHRRACYQPHRRFFQSQAVLFLVSFRLVLLGDRKSTRLNSSHLVISYA